MTTPPDSSAIRTLFQNIGIINQLSGAVARRALGSGSAGGANMGTSELSVLGRSIRIGDGETPTKLARLFQLSKPSMTAIITKLERKGFVELCADADDARSKRVYVTEAGRAAHAAAEGALGVAMARELAGIDVAALLTAAPGVALLKAHMDERRNGVDGL
ncbi:MAG: MarR family transcriptional regulator [Pseudomonadota bacterium]